MTGLAAVDLAAAGFTGPTDILDHPDYYDGSGILADLGHGFAIEGVYFKPYACCRWIHSALDALGDILSAHRLAVEQVTAVTVHTFERALRLNNYPDPDSLEAAQYSLPFCLGVAATQGRAALLPLKAESLHRRETVAFARRVSLAVDPELDRLFPEKTAARVVVAAGGKRFEKRVTDPFGDPLNPMGFDHLTAKFKRLTQHRLTAARQQQMVTAIERFEETGLRPVLDILASC
jgi:2-methylcitrate dehydratase PrpD